VGRLRGHHGAALEKVAITGGPPITLLRADTLLRGATWAVDDSVIFATGNPGTGCCAYPPRRNAERC
jgi:hypothetical protein